MFNNDNLKFLFPHFLPTIILVFTMVPLTNSVRSSRRIALRASVAVVEEAKEKEDANNSHGSSRKSTEIASILDKISAVEDNVDRSEVEATALGSLDITKRHQSRQNKLEEAFISALKSVVDRDGKMKYEDLLVKVENPYYNSRRSDSSKKVPKCFTLCSGKITPDILELANCLCVDYQVRYKKKKIGSDGICWYAPVTQKAEFRTFLAHMAKTHGWQFTAGHFEGFQGSLNAVMKVLYEKRLEEFVSIEVHWMNI